MYSLYDYSVFESSIYFIVSSVNSSIPFNKKLIVKRPKNTIEHINDIFFNLTKENISISFSLNSDVVWNYTRTFDLITYDEHFWVNNYDLNDYDISNITTYNIFPTPGKLTDL